MFLQRKSQFGAALMIAGGLLAVAGEVMTIRDSDVLGSSWHLTLGLIIVGTLLLVTGLSIFASASNVIDGIGFLGSTLILLGGLAMIVATLALDWIVLPFLIHLARTIAATVNGPATAAQNEVNSIVSTVNGLGGSTIHNLFPGTTPTITAPHIPTVDGTTIVDNALTQLHIPTLSTLQWWGRFSLSGGPLTLGCLVLGLALLSQRSSLRSVGIVLIIFALLNLLSQFLSQLPAYTANISAIVLFLALAWLGLSAWSTKRTHTLTRMRARRVEVGRDFADDEQWRRN